MDACIGIITRTKDRPALLKRALESVVHQSFDDWIMVVVNDGGDPAAVDALVDIFSPRARGNIRVIHNPVSLGMEAASNRGIASIHTEYLAIHDDDDSWAPDFLAIAIAELELVKERFPQVAAVITMANSIYERMDGNTVRTESVEPYKPWIKQGFLSFDSMLIENQFAPIQMLFSYDAASKIGFFREDLPVLGDWDFNVRLMANHDIYVIPQVLAFYHHRVADQGIYGNSIHAGRAKHAQYSQLLRNEWLRADLAAGEIGIGAMGSLRWAIQHLQWTLEELRNQQWDLAHRIDALRQQNVVADLQFRDSRDVKSQPVRNAFRLIKFWLQSGRPVHYVAQTFRFLSAQGPKATIGRVKLWMIAQGEVAQSHSSALRLPRSRRKANRDNPIRSVLKKIRMWVGVKNGR